MSQEWSIFSFKDFESTFKILELDMDHAEYCRISEEFGFTADQMSAVDQVFDYLREKKVNIKPSLQFVSYWAKARFS